MYITSTGAGPCCAAELHTHLRPQQLVQCCMLPVCFASDVAGASSATVMLPAQWACQAGQGCARPSCLSSVRLQTQLSPPSHAPNQPDPFMQQDHRSHLSHVCCRACQTVMSHLAEGLTRAVAPVAAHLAEDAWQNLPFQCPAASIFQAGWQEPHPDWSSLPEQDQAHCTALLAVRAETNQVPLPSAAPANRLQKATFDRSSDRCGRKSAVYKRHALYTADFLLVLLLYGNAVEAFHSTLHGVADWSHASQLRPASLQAPSPWCVTW